jgi:hypothetical protein
MRVAALVQLALYVAMACVILSRAGLTLPRWSNASMWLTWIVVALGAVSLVLNLITPSGGERLIWAPVALALLAFSVAVALGPIPHDGPPANHSPHGKAQLTEEKAS